MMHGECRRVDVGQSPDLIPGLLAILVLEVAGEILEYQAVHSSAEGALWVSRLIKINVKDFYFLLDLDSVGAMTLE